MPYPPWMLDRLGIPHPLVQAPMAGVSTPAMAAAVSNAGALGSLAVGAVDADAARRTIADTRARSSRPLNVNVFCHAPAHVDPTRDAAWIARFRPELERLGGVVPTALREIYRSFVVDEDMLAALVSARPEVVSFHFGVPPAAAVRALRDAGIVLLGSATSLDEARTLEAAGVHAVVAQGWEAGGHRGSFHPATRDDRLGTLSLVRLLVRALSVPVLAAGGLMDGAGIRAALALGACAAQLGTAFVLCPESSADDGYRAAMRGATHTVTTRVISGRLARGLPNRFTALGEAIPDEAIPDYPIAYDLGKALHAAAKARADHTYGAHWAGQGAPLAREMGAADLVATLVREAAPAFVGSL